MKQNFNQHAFFVVFLCIIHIISFESLKTTSTIDPGRWLFCGNQRAILLKHDICIYGIDYAKSRISEKVFCQGDLFRLHLNVVRLRRENLIFY